MPDGEAFPGPIPASMLLNPGVLDDPYPFYTRLRAAAPVWQVPGSEIFVVTKYALIEEATRRVEDFSSNLRAVLYRTRKGLPARFTKDRGLLQVLATADPPIHGAHKKAVFPELAARRMAGMTADIEQITDDCLDRLVRAGSGDFMKLVANPVPIAVVSKLIGFKNPDLPKLLRAAFDSTAIVGATLSKLQLAVCMLRSLMTFRSLARELRAGRTDGEQILPAVKRSIEQGALREVEGIAILHMLLAAGGESTTSLIGNAVRVLAEDRRLQDQLRQQPELIPAFLEEMLRVESPFRFHLRHVLRETELGGVPIPSGATVLLFWAAGNRDPDVFARPDVIDLARPKVHMTFGRGIHTCVGAPLARLEGGIVLRKLLARTRQISLDVHRPPQWVSSLQVRRHEHLHINVET